MYFIDTHTHIYLSEFDDDRDEIMKKAQESNVEFTIMPAIDSSTHGAMLAMEKTYENCFSMIGLHPCSVNQDYEKELSIINQYLEKRNFLFNNQFSSISNLSKNLKSPS